MFHTGLRSRVLLLPAILVVFLHVPAAATPLTTVADVGTALCDNATVTLGGHINDASAVLTVAVNCTATLDLNGHTLTVSRVVLGTGADLTIRDSTLADGELIAKGAVNDEAGIRTTGATLRIVSGTVSATGGSTAAGIGGRNSGAGGTVMISGGTVTANGGEQGAGIGGGRLRDGGTITVSGGTVTATGGEQGAGIGGGNQRAGGTITISGGSVMATGGAQGAGIGGGPAGAGGTITVSGGTVTATGGTNGAGIGSGHNGGAGGTITISGGTVTATGGTDAAGIGGGRAGAGGTITISGGMVTATSGFTSASFGIGPGSGGTAGDVTIGDGLIRADTELDDGQRTTTLTPVPVPVPAAVSVLALSCAPSVPVVGALVTCTVTGGDAGVEILWRAAYNPTFAEAGVTLDAGGTGTFSFVVPRAALGEPLMVELVEWTAPLSIGVAGGPVPASVPAGDGPSSPAGRVVLLLVLVGLMVAVVVRRVVGMTA